jgi:hypothetical protein
MDQRRRAVKRAAYAVVLTALAGGAATLAASAAQAAEYTNEVHDCYSIMWNTDWDQRCDGADEYGLYYSKTDCSAADTGRELNIVRAVGSTNSYDGDDCIFGIEYDNSYISYLGEG